jgi:hypothetical protein
VTQEPESGTAEEPGNGAAGDVDGVAGGPAVSGALDRPEAFAIPHLLAQATLDYLASRPYREVYQLVQAFEALEPLPAADR